MTRAKVGCSLAALLPEHRCHVVGTTRKASSVSLYELKKLRINDRIALEQRSLENVEQVYRLIDDYRPKDFILATGKHTPLHVFASKAFEAVVLFWEDYVVHNKEFVRSQDRCHPRASVNETNDRLGWTATVQMPELVQRLLKDCKKSDEANYSDF